MKNLILSLVLVLLALVSTARNFSFSNQLEFCAQEEIVFNKEFKEAQNEKFASLIDPMSNEQECYLQYPQGYADFDGSNPCFSGQQYAEMYHGTTGAFFAGFLFGPFGVIGAAIVNPSVPYSIPSDYQVRQCYQQKAKKKNVGAAALGWLTEVLLFGLLVGAGS